MSLNPYLFFNGECEAAFRFYEQCLGGKTEILKHTSETCKQLPPDWRDKVMHARLTRENMVLMGSDAPPEHYRAPGGFSVAVHVNEPTEAERIFQALSDHGTVTMPLQKTYWSASFGMLVDRFGVPWMVNCEAAAA